MTILLLFYILQHLLLHWHCSMHVLTHSILTLCNLIRYVYYMPILQMKKLKSRDVESARKPAEMVYPGGLH